MANAKFIGVKDFEKLVSTLIDSQKVFAPVKVYDHLQFKNLSKDDLAEIVIGEYCTIAPAKQLFYPIAENVLAEPKVEPFVVIGAKACDLSALEVIDNVYGSNKFKDPFYLNRRMSALIITADCTNAKDTCFCRLVKGNPYAEKGFDLNLSKVDGGYVVEVGSPKGEKLISDNSSFFTDASQKANDEKDQNRKKMEQLVDDINRDYTFKADLSEIHRQTLESVPPWREITKSCVDCQACNRVCPSCTCFLLVDQVNEGNEEKIKVWDNCLHAGYTRVAGGANDRGALSSRLQNRYHCKFDYTPTRIGRFSCVGCGRCIDACMGKIDMRKVFKDLEKAAVLSAKLA